MPILQKINVENYCANGNSSLGVYKNTTTRIFPRDNYSAFINSTNIYNKNYAKALAAFDRYYFLKVPLLGQHNLQAKAECIRIKEPKYYYVWCGRTSASMIYNYYQLIRGGEPHERYITHWTGPGNDRILDLRFPDKGHLAFQDIEDDSTGWSHSGCRPSKLLLPDYLKHYTDNLDVIPKYTAAYLFQTENLNRIGHGSEELKKGEQQLQVHFSGIIKSIKNNNPVLLYSGISRSGALQHIVLITGIFYHNDTLWFMICDPSTPLRMKATNKHAFNVCNDPSSIDNSHQMIILDGGDFFNCLGSLYLLKASVFFEKHKLANKLWMDASDYLYGYHFLCHEQTPAFAETVEAKGIPVNYSNAFTLPFATLGGIESPLKYYYNNECATSGIGGYYAMGLQRNLHGGIHLYPEQSSKAVQTDSPGTKAPAEKTDATPVHCMAPGYIVAARFPEKNSDVFKLKLLSEIGNWAGFILVRHVLTATQSGSDTDSTPQEYFLYSLYMHLASPDYASIYEDPYYQNVPWLKLFFERQYGCFVKIAAPFGETPETKAPVGTIVWARQAVNAESPGNGPFKVDNPDIKQVTLNGENNRPVWHYKKPVADYTELITDLKAGKTITFSEPFFQVNSGDVIGYVKPVPGIKEEKKVRFKMNINGKESTCSQFLKSGFLHWEVFSQAGDNSAVEWLIEKASEIKAIGTEQFKIISENSTTEENFLSTEEISGQSGDTLRNALPETEQAKFVTEWSEVQARLEKNPFGYAPMVIELLNDGTSFAPQKETDWNSGKSFTYPVKLQIDSTDLPRPSDNELTYRHKYDIKVQFKKRKAGTGIDESDMYDIIDAETPIMITDKTWNATCIEITLQVPADIDAITLIPGWEISLKETEAQPDQTDNSIELFASVTDSRWRNAKIDHLNEWSPDVMGKLYNKLSLENVFQSPVQVESVTPLAWWKSTFANDFKRWAATPDSSPQGGSQSTLFSADNDPKFLRPDARLHNLHPVTAAWMLSFLQAKNIMEIKPSFDAASFGRQDNKLFAWGWACASSDRPKIGDKIAIVVIDDDYSYDKKIQASVKIINKATGKKIDFKEHSYIAAGIAIVEVTVEFWGKWTVEINGNQQSPNSVPGLIPTIDIQIFEFAPVSFICGHLQRMSTKVFQPFIRKDGFYQWTIPLTKELKVLQVNGWIKIATAINDGLWKTNPEQYVVKAISTATKNGTNTESVKNQYYNIAGDFIVGLNLDGVRELKKGNGCPLTSTINFTQVWRSSDTIYAACSLVNDVQAICDAYQKKLTIVEIAADGLSCVLADLKDTVRMVNMLIGNKPSILSNIDMKKSFDQDNKLEGILVTVTDAQLQEAQLCLRLNITEKINLSSDRKWILGGSKNCSVSRSFKISDFISYNIFVNTYLIEALHQLKSKVKNLDIQSISNDGCSCLVTGKNVEQSAAELNIFSDISTSKSGTTLIISPFQTNAITVTFKPENALSKILTDTEAKNTLSCNDRLRYRFMFTVANGGNRVITGQVDDMNGGVNNHSILDAVSADQMVYFGWSEQVGEMKPNVFGECRSFLVNINSMTYLRVVAALHGKQSFWEKKKIICKLRMGTGKEAVFKGTKVFCQGYASILFTIPLKSSNGNASMAISVDSPENTIVPQPVSLNYDFTPSFISTTLAITPDIEDTTFVKIRAEARAINVPPGADKPWGFGNKIKAIIRGGATSFKLTVSPDINVMRLKGSSPLLSTLIEFALPGGTAQGYCDRNGIFEARVKKQYLSTHENSDFKLEMATAAGNHTISGRYTIKPTQPTSSSEHLQNRMSQLQP